MADVFVSYKAEDRRRVKPLVEALQADGFSVWWDEQIGGGAAWRHAIETELNAAKCVIVVWSKRSVGPDGTFVQDEATRAQQRHVYVPVTIDKVHLPLGFGETQALPLAGWHGDRADPHYQAVHSAVARNVGGKRRRTTAALSAPGVDRRTAIAGGAVAAAAAAGIGGWAFLRSSPVSAARSIAVLPFANLSGDPAQAYFSDGIAEEIRSALNRIAGLKVAGSTSSDAVRNDDAQTAAKKLDVTNILTGSVRQSPSTIRVSAELIDGSTGLDKWSQDYDRSPGDAIKIQTDIAANVAGALSATLGEAARAAIAVGGTSNAAAQKLYLKAKAQLHADDRENSLRTAIGLVDAAIALDPKFAEGYALKARAMSDLNGYFTAPGAGFAPGFVQAASVAQQAISIAPDLAAGHMALAAIRKWQLDVGAAAVEYQRGHSLAGGDVDDLLAYVGFLWILDRTDEAIDFARQAQARDPLNPATYSAEGSAQFNAGRFPKAVAAFQKALDLAPNLSGPRGRIGAALVEMDKFDEAEVEFRKLPPNNLFRLVGEAVLFARQGNRAASDAALQHAEQANGDDGHYQYAEVHAQRGEKDEAFASLDRAWSFHDPGLAIMKADRYMIPLRGDPRFEALLKKMNFPS
jgi:TolB-like protein/tetratricopeptide (TPR) repeat protein